MKSQVGGGTAPYAAPEILADDGSAVLDHLSPRRSSGQGITSAVDFWATGVLFHELLSGALPFPGYTGPQILEAIRQPDQPWTEVCAISSEALEVCRGWLTVDPALRLGGCDSAELNSLRFFAEVPWETMHEELPPFIPTISGPTDTSYFKHLSPVTSTIHLSEVHRLVSAESFNSSLDESFKSNRSTSRISTSCGFALNIDALSSLAHQSSAAATVLENSEELS